MKPVEEIAREVLAGHSFVATDNRRYVGLLAEPVEARIVAALRAERERADAALTLVGIRTETAHEALARAEKAEANLDAGRELIRQAWNEFNAIRARYGAPEGVDPAWWDTMTERLGALLGDDTVPWMTSAARALIAPYEASAEKAEAERDEAREETLTVLHRETATALRYDERIDALETALATARNRALEEAAECVKDCRQWEPECPHAARILSLRIPEAST